MKMQISFSVNPPDFDAYQIRTSRIVDLQMGGRALVQCNGQDLWELRQSSSKGWAWVKLVANDNVYSNGIYVAKQGQFPLVSVGE